MVCSRLGSECCNDFCTESWYGGKPQACRCRNVVPVPKMRLLTSFETPIAGVVNGVTLFYERSRRGAGQDWKAWAGRKCSVLCTGRISVLRLCFGNVDVQISFRWEICEEEPSPEVWRALRGARELWIEQVRPAAPWGEYSDSYCRVPPSKLSIGQGIY